MTSSTMSPTVAAPGISLLIRPAIGFVLSNAMLVAVLVALTSA